MSELEWIPFGLESTFESKGLVEEFIDALGSVYQEITPAEIADEFERLRRQYLRKLLVGAKSGKQAGAAVINLLTDLSRQGWSFRCEGQLLMKPPQGEGREVRRAQLLAQRMEQLRSTAVQSFVRSMERPRWFKGRRVSIFSLIRDGRDLASALEKVVSQGAPPSLALRPYLQFVHSGETCEHTGLEVSDIWRYFRYTWVNPYQSVPGRTMMFLVRDASSPYHPVMGLGALSSAAVKLRGRDEFLGWEAEAVLDSLAADPNIKSARWIEGIIERRIDEIFKADLIEDGILPLNIKEPSEALIQRLRSEAKERRSQHHAYMEAKDYKRHFDSAPGNKVRSQEEWEKLARLPLFRSKRADELANLFVARRVIRNCSSEAPRDSIRELLRNREGREAVTQLVRLAKATRVGTAIADLTVCGAIPPYNPLLVGKLVALLAVSPEVVRENRCRYGKRASEIASSMAGREIIRPADLVFIGTTSLYGERPCQYDRISVPAELLGGTKGTAIRYRFIDDTVGWGTFQFSDATTKAIMRYVKAEKNGQRVNYVFGEGANPKMRALREGLAALGFDEEKLLKHGHQRSMYGVSLVSNLTEYLLGQDKKPQYLYDLKTPENSSKAIVDWWAQRWLAKRLVRPETLDEVRKHTLIHPIEHGARVRLPASDPEQFSLLS